jgi:uncharacterized protein YjiS (DUF1127 family)
MAHALTLTHENLSLLKQRGLPLVAVIAVKLAVCVTTWATRRRTRLALQQLSDWQLRDVGLTPDQARSEASRVFWRM